jgi:hypothetical protein
MYGRLQQQLSSWSSGLSDSPMTSRDIVRHKDPREYLKDELNQLESKIKKQKEEVRRRV